MDDILDPGPGKYTEIGAGHHYETLAFHAKYDKSNKCWDADVEKQIYFKSEWRWPNFDDEMKAQAGHEKVVKEIVKMLEANA